MIPNFVDCHSHPRSLDSASTPEAFAKKEAELGTGYLTMTDHGYMGAALEVYNTAKKYGLKPILGCEIYLRSDDCDILSSHGIEKDKEGTYSNYSKYYHVTLAAKNQEAYQALVYELSVAHERAERHGSENKPIMTWEQLEELGQYEITFGSGCLVGAVQKHLMNDRPDIAEAYYLRLKTIAKPGNFFVEVFPHACTHNWTDAIFVTVDGGDERERLKFYDGKTLLTNVGEIRAKDLARAPAKHTQLKGIKNRHIWDEFEPRTIVEVEAVAGFVQNECAPDTPDGDIQFRGNMFVLQMAHKYGDRVQISNDSHFATPDEHIIQDMRLMSAGGSWRMHNSYHRQTGKEAYEFFERSLGLPLKVFEGWVENTYEWASGFDGFELKYSKSLPTKFYPEDTVGHLMTLINKHGRMDWGNSAMVGRLQAEVAMLHGNGVIDLLPYFFVPEEAIAHYTDMGGLGFPGRGSAAGMLISFLLNITQVNPLKADLPMERFLTLDRIQSGVLPDIDMDFGARDILMNPKTGWLKTRFGDHYAQISTDTVLKLKSAIKDVCRARWKFVLPEIEDICKRLPNEPQGVSSEHHIFGYTSDDGEEVPGIIDTERALQEYIAKYPDDWKLVQGSLKLTRSKSVHACGVAILNEPVQNRIPTMDMSGVRVTQYTADYVEQVGGVKYDFLSLSSLKDVQDAIKMIQENSGMEIPGSLFIEGRGNVPASRLLPHSGFLYDIWELPDDQNVYSEIANGQTETVFQFDTPGAKQWIHFFNYEIRPGVKAINAIESLAAFTALDRPGPLNATVGGDNGHNMLVEYAYRARGLPATDSIQIMNEIIPDTLGVMIFQEDLTKVYQYLTGCSGAEAEAFRRDVGKKNVENVERAYTEFMTRATEKISQSDAEQIWGQIKEFANYGFSKNHAIPYVMVSYACAFLKHHYPLEWWAAVLGNADKNEIGEKFWPHIGHKILMPDINLSGDNWQIEGENIRAPLSLLSGIGPKATEELNTGRPYQSLLDMAQKIESHKKTTSVEVEGKVKVGRSALNIGVMAKLAVSGALDSMYPPDTTDAEKIDMWLGAMRDASGKKRKGKFPDAYNISGELARYQIRKEILPIYSASLQEAAWREDESGLIVRRDSYYAYQPKNDDPIRLVSAEEFRAMESVQIGMPLTVAVVAYVQGKREFSYKGDNRAVALILEVDGVPLEFVRWPNKRTGRPELPDGVEVGAIIATTLERWSDGSKFSLGNIHVVKPKRKNK